jgi:prepilin-type N-terminal cleavage/methylation domain-containing protein
MLLKKFQSVARLSSGFTLIELMIVIAIVGVLIALLLPAVQAARESARRTQCTNHLKQIGLAIHNFYEAGRVLPTGGTHAGSGPIRTTSGRFALPPKQQLGWPVQILSFLEESNIEAMPNYALLVRTAIETYFCPSRRGPTIVNAAYGLRATLDYCAVSGPGGEFYNGSLPDYPPSTYHGVIIRASALGGIDPQFSPKFIRMKDVTDGTSRSMVISEKRMNPQRYTTSDMGDDNGYCEGWDMDIVRMTNSVTDPSNNAYVLAVDGVPEPGYDWNLNNALGSAHTGGVNGVFADGAVHLIAYEIDQQVLDSLGNRHDGLMLQLNGVY